MEKIFTTTNTITVQPIKTLIQASNFSHINIKVTNKNRNVIRITSSWNPNIQSSSYLTTKAVTDTKTQTLDLLNSSNSDPQQCHWIVVMEKPLQGGILSKSDVIDYYVKTLSKVLGSEKEAQMCIYNASWKTHFGFCCDIDEAASRVLSGLPEVLSVRPDLDFEPAEKDYTLENVQLGGVSSSNAGMSRLFTEVNSKYWLVRMEKPNVEVVTKAQMVDYYAQILSKVLGNVMDAQMCIYHISWKNNFGFCCELDDDCARELEGVPGVMSVHSDENFGSENKDYGGDDKSANSADTNEKPHVKTKRLFVTGLSFYTSEKTLRAAFEGFGDLVEVKIIMDKISKRSKGYAFIEYTTEDAAGAALKEMDGKIINGWMIVVDVAKTNPPKFNRGQPRPTF